MNDYVFCIATPDRGLLAFLNSRLAWYWITHTCPANRGGAYRLFNHYMNQLPVHPEVLQHPELASSAEAMVLASRRLVAARLPHDKYSLQSQIAATDRQIDRLVYELYGLTDEEIRIVEGQDPGSANGESGDGE